MKRFPVFRANRPGFHAKNISAVDPSDRPTKVREGSRQREPSGNTAESSPPLKLRLIARVIIYLTLHLLHFEPYHLIRNKLHIQSLIQSLQRSSSGHVHTPSRTCRR